VALRGSEDIAELRRLSSLFLDSKEFTGAHGLEVSDDMAVAIAAQACLPVLRLGLKAFDGFVGIVVHPDEVQVRREIIDDDGIVHEYDDVLAGEAMEGGPVMLSWRDVSEAGESSAWGYNVVVHEFAHVLDMGDGLADGIPPLASASQRVHWQAVLMREYEAFCARVDAEEDTALDPYGAESPEEFFAVASEAFFVAPRDMRAEHSALYELLSGYYRQDPAA
jgi:Mlc titration factor MtfA (ptsG expression regulator)